jgi:GH25 family lysozyme M1 (1,4-beta-N-acetylmuramidase)
MIGFGIDLSHFQNPATLPWPSWRDVVNFVIVRAAYGSAHDRFAVEHVSRARDIGAKVGLYLFFRPSDPVAGQLSALHAVADGAHIDDGDIVPAVDIERDPFPSPGTDVAPAWSAPAEDLADQIVSTWGNVLLYVTHREWTMLGSPAWVLRRPLWTAHYHDAPPVTPGGMPATIHQHRVGPFDPAGPGGYFAGSPQIDQNRLLRPLPLIGQPISDEEKTRIEQSVALWLDSEASGNAKPFPLPEDS